MLQLLEITLGKEAQTGLVVADGKMRDNSHKVWLGTFLLGIRITFVYSRSVHTVPQKAVETTLLQTDLASYPWSFLSLS